MVHQKGDDMKLTGGKTAKQSAQQPASSFFDENFLLTILRLQTYRFYKTKIQISQNEKYNVIKSYTRQHSGTRAYRRFL